MLMEIETSMQTLSLVCNVSSKCSPYLSMLVNEASNSFFK